MTMEYGEFLRRIVHNRYQGSDIGKDLRELIQEDGVLPKFLDAVWTGREQLKEQLSQAAFWNEEGRFQAVNLQGKIQGIDFVFQSLYQLLNAEPEEKDNG